MAAVAACIWTTLAMALSMLDHRPKEDRKVAIIFSDGYNIGSQTKRSEIVQRSMNSNITLYGLGFSPVRGLWTSRRKIRHRIWLLKV